MQWYYAKEDQRVGPLSESEFQTLIQNGTVKGDTRVWRTGMSTWQTYAEIGGVALGAATAVADSGADDTAVCAASGKRYPKREMIEYQGRWISAEHRDAYFQRLREGVAVSGMNYAGFWIRFVAKIIDGLIMWGLGIATNLIFGLGLMGRAKGPGAFMLFAGAFFVRIGLQLLYYWFFLARYEATLGKMALGLKVVRSDGSRITTGRIIGRYFAEWLSAMIICIGYIIAAFDDQKRALHDHICDTRVIKTR